MQKLFFFTVLMCLSFHFTSAQEIRYVTAPSGLNVRQEPKLEGKILGKIVYATKVVLTETTKEQLAIIDEGKNISGYWVKIQYDNGNKRGYVFDGFLSDAPVKELLPLESLQKKLTFFNAMDVLTLRKYFSDEIIMEYDRIQSIFRDQNKNTDVIKLFFQTRELKKKIIGYINENSHYSDIRDTWGTIWIPDLGKVEKKVKGIFSSCAGECMDYYAHLRIRDFLTLSQNQKDKTFFELIKMVDGNGDPSGDFYPGWITYTWDYGGYSNLGDGSLIDFLKKSKAYFDLYNLDENDKKRIYLSQYRSIIISDLNHGDYGKTQEIVLKEVQAILESDILYLEEKKIIKMMYEEIKGGKKKFPRGEWNMQFECETKNCSFG